MFPSRRRHKLRGIGTVLTGILLVSGASAQDVAPPPSGMTSNAREESEPAAAEGSPSPRPGTAATKEKDAKRKAPAPYKEPFYNNDFSYLDDPDYVSRDPFDRFKRMDLTPRTALDVGGEVRLRLHDEENLRLDGRGNDYLLQRTRLYGDLRYDDWLRGYAELIDSTISFERQPPRASEEDRLDVLNLFLDVRLWEDGRGGSLWTRVGRQELDYGNQRLVAAAIWANDRLTFDGVKTFWKSKSWDVDAFWTQPVPFARTGSDRNFRPADRTEQFLGVYAVWHEVKDQTVDLYYLRLERDRRVLTGDQPLVPFDANTFGARGQGRHGRWLWEVEGAYQFGRYSGDVQSAGFYVAGVGYEWKPLPWQPVLWLYYDWASGTDDPGGHRRGTFNQLFVQTHRFLGVTDVLGRQNLEDLNFLLLAKPHERVALSVEGHLFRLESARDSLYNNGGAAVRTDPTGRAGADVGRELDFNARIQLTSHADLLLSYGYFFAGRFLSNTGVGNDADALYAQFAFKF